jgi:hypothetical protein
MIDTKLPLRRAYYSMLNGNITSNGNNVPVYDDVIKLGDETNLYILLSSQTSNDDSTLCCFASTDTMLLDIVYKAQGRTNKQVVDTIANQIFSLILPSVAGNGLPEQPEIEIYHPRVESDSYVTMTLGASQQIVRRLITFTHRIKQK